MKELIKITESGIGNIVSAKELYSFLGYAPQHWAKWYKNNILNDDFFEQGRDYTQLPLGGSSKTPDFAIVIDMAKELCMLARNEKGKEARQYFIACEKKLKEVSVPKTYAEALLEAGRLALEVETKNKQIELMAPKAEFFDQVTGSKDCFDMADVAKVCNLGVGRNILFKFLRDSKILRENNTPYQQFIDSGHFRVIESKFNKPDGSVCINLKTVVYQKGIDFIIKRYVGRKLT